MLISGAICGLAAALYITGNSPHGIATLAAFENTGFNGLAVCLIAASSPIGCIFAGLLFGGLIYGGQTLHQHCHRSHRVLRCADPYHSAAGGTLKESPPGKTWAECLEGREIICLAV